MPELPDVVVYVEALERRLVGRRLTRLRVQSPFVLRSVEPPPADLEGRAIRGVERLGKRVVIGFEPDRFAVIHLMIAGRLRWMEPGRKPPGRITLATFEVEGGGGMLALTEAGTRRRASLHLVRGRDGVRRLDPGGLEPLAMSLEEFRTRVRSENHTIKRALTDPRLIAGIGNAYSDEILHRARLSPLVWSTRLTDPEIERLYRATRETLTQWVERLRALAEETGGFPERVTAFREGMAVHGRFGRPCSACGAPVQRIRYAENETNYCARCQTGGRRLADRALSRLLGDDWPRSLDEL